MYHITPFPRKMFDMKPIWPLQNGGRQGHPTEWLPPRPNKVTYGCYPSIPHALRFTKGDNELTTHPVDSTVCTDSVMLSIILFLLYWEPKLLKFLSDYTGQKHLNFFRPTNDNGWT
jgi:hypothetical protein